MTKPSRHAFSMFLFSLLLWLLGISTDILSFVKILIYSIAFGAVIPDLDHIDFKDPIGWVVKFVRHEKVALPKGTKLWLHTFSALAVMIVALILFRIFFPTLLPVASYYLPLLAFMTHMVIDGANRANNKPWQSGAYLPWFIHNKIIRKYCPPQWLKRITYYYNEGKKEEEEEKENQEVINTVKIISTPEIYKKQEVNRLLDQLVLYGLIFMLAGGLILFVSQLNYFFNVIFINKIYLYNLVAIGTVLLVFGFITSYLGYKKLKLKFK